MIKDLNLFFSNENLFFFKIVSMAAKKKKKKKKKKEAPAPLNGQTYSNNLSAKADELALVLKGLINN